MRVVEICRVIVPKQSRIIPFYISLSFMTVTIHIIKVFSNGLTGLLFEKSHEMIRC